MTTVKNILHRDSDGNKDYRGGRMKYTFLYIAYFLAVAWMSSYLVKDIQMVRQWWLFPYVLSIICVSILPIIYFTGKDKW